MSRHFKRERAKRHFKARVSATTQSSKDQASLAGLRRQNEGFTLVEMMIALLILALGLLAAGQMIYVALGSASLARSKANAAVVAQGRLHFLADLYSRDPEASELTDGEHGPDQVQMVNPATNKVLNRFNVSWTVSTVPDPRPNRVILAKQVSVTVSPIDAGTRTNLKVGLNKIVTVAAVFSVRTS